MLDFDNSVKTEQDLGPRPTMSLAPETPCRMRPISFEDRETPPPLPYQMQAESWGAVLPLWDSGFVVSMPEGFYMFSKSFCFRLCWILQEGLLVPDIDQGRARGAPRAMAEEVSKVPNV